MVVVEQWILDFALRNNFSQVVRELESAVATDGGGAYWLISALRIIVFDRQFAKFPVAHRIVQVLTRALPNTLIDEDEAFQLKFYLNLMSVLGAVGNSSATSVVQLLRETFDTAVDDDNLSELQTDITKNTFKAVRHYVLRLLLKDTRQRHFAERKFPESFADVLSTLDAITKKLINNAWRQLPSSKLEMLAAGSPIAEVVDEAKDVNDPGVALFVESFGGRLPSEPELITFLQQIKDSQLTLTPPDLFAAFTRRSASTKARATSNTITRSKTSRSKMVPIRDYGSNDSPIDGSDEMFSSSPNHTPTSTITSTITSRSASDSQNTSATNKNSNITKDCIVAVVPLEFTVHRKFLK